MVLLLYLVLDMEVYSISEAITLSGQRIIQESALCANRHMNKVIA
jgi:hypothetical protein